MINITITVSVSHVGSNFDVNSYDVVQGHSMVEVLSKLLIVTNQINDRTIEDLRRELLMKGVKDDDIPF